MRIFLLGLLLVVSPIVISDDTEDYRKVFERFQELGETFDKSIVELYADDAEIIGVRKMPDGADVTMRMDGLRWKQLISNTMDISKQRGDISKYSEIKISVEGGRAKITANRYSTIKCFNDEKYYIVLEREHDSEIKIVEQYSESPMASNCSDIPENDLSLVLQATEKYFSDQLPISVDSDTSLERVISDDRSLTLEYVLVNFSKDEIDNEAFERGVRPLAIQQTCALPSFKSILDQGGTISYVYFDKNRIHMLAIDTDKNAC